MIYSVENELLKISADQKGAELVSVFSKKTRKEFLWSGDPAFWPRHFPILFPIVGKLKDDKYKIGNTFFFMKEHGFARDSIFSLDKKEHDTITFVLNENEDTLKIYPYRFVLRISYKIKETQILINAQVENCEEQTLLFSLGFHPAFCCPFEEHEKIEDYCLVFEKEEKCKRLILEEGLISKTETFLLKNKNLTLSEDLFLNDAIILKKLLSEKIFLKKIGSEIPMVEIDFKGFDYLGLWKKRGARFICIEPWKGVNDYKNSNYDFIKKEGVVFLEPSQKIEFEMAIQIYD
ncbi:MAG: aldose 1-epimerase family protein [Acidobacteria bacterium]|nr:aldose 1-epimerase family protein [Acidobacteriota bacterium]